MHFCIILLIIFSLSCEIKNQNLIEKNENIEQSYRNISEKIKSPIEAKFEEIGDMKVGNNITLLLKIKLEVDCEDITVNFKYPSKLKTTNTEDEITLSLKKNIEASIPQTFFIPDEKRYIIDALISCETNSNTVLSKSVSYVIDLGEKEVVDKNTIFLKTKDGESVRVNISK